MDAAANNHNQSNHKRMGNRLDLANASSCAVLYCTQPDFVCFICTDLKEDISTVPCKASATVLLFETLRPSEDHK